MNTIKRTKEKEFRPELLEENIKSEIWDYISRPNAGKGLKYKRTPFDELK